MFMALCELCAAVLLCPQSERKTDELQFSAGKWSGKVCPKLPGGITERSNLISQIHSIMVLGKTSKGQPVHSLPEAGPPLSMLIMPNLLLKVSSAKHSYIPQTSRSPGHKASRNLFFLVYTLLAISKIFQAPVLKDTS